MGPPPPSSDEIDDSAWRDALLAQAQQLDAERGEGVVELASAVEALRSSGDLLAKVSEE